MIRFFWGKNTHYYLFWQRFKAKRLAQINEQGVFTEGAYFPHSLH